MFVTEYTNTVLLVQNTANTFLKLNIKTVRLDSAKSCTNPVYAHFHPSRCPSVLTLRDYAERPDTDSCQG